MPQVRVYNDNKYQYRESFEDRDIVIEPGKFVVMEENEAIRFKGAFVAPRMTPMKTPDERFFKKIRLEPHAKDEAPEAPKFVCQFDAKEFSTQAELDAHIDANYLDRLEDQEFADKRRKAIKK